jgi:nucleotide-binding universal stress UspA family protein
MYKTILVPLDGSKRAEKILPYVEELASRCGAKLVLLEVIDPFSIVVGPEGSTYTALEHHELERRTQDEESYLEKIKEGFGQKGIEAATRVVNGSVVQQILNTAQREGADLIALTSHGRTGLSRVFYGSVAAGVLHSVDRPLLVIRSLGDE